MGEAKMVPAGMDILILALLITGPLGNEVKANKGHWTKLHTGSYQFATWESLNWEQARDYCIKEGGRLAEIGSQTEQNEIVQHIQAHPSLQSHFFWIGLNDRAHEG